MNLVVWVLWGEIEVDFDDAKHIVLLIRRLPNKLGSTIVGGFRGVGRIRHIAKVLCVGLGRKLVASDLNRISPQFGEIRIAPLFR